jgi:ribosomal protein S18 acetylase RimI-like enzyme
VDDPDRATKIANGGQSGVPRIGRCARAAMARKYFAPPAGLIRMNWTIRNAERADAGQLPAIEYSAGRRFLAIPGLAFVADADDMPAEAHRRYIALGTEWVALNVSQEIVGFLAAEIVGRDLHIWELAVRADSQNQGIGSRLIETATAFARERNLDSLTLTTFANVIWNAPWYERLGFVATLGDERLTAIVQTETERGLPDRCAMRKNLDPVRISTEEASDIEAFLAAKVYEYNARATGYFDGKSFSAIRRDSSGAIRAGISGYTWGGCCYISYLWVDESMRGRGIGTTLVNAAEKHAASRGARRMLLATHSFQAPAFYQKLGYEQEAVVRDHPSGHANFFFAKPLVSNSPS